MRTNNQQWLHRAFELLYPLIGISLFQRFRVKEQDADDIIQYAALRLWKMLLRRKIPAFETDGHWNVWTGSTIYYMLCSGYMDLRRGEVPEKVEENPGQAWHVSHYGSPIDSEDGVFLLELPATIEGRIQKTLRLPKSEWLGVRYVLRQMFRGKLPVPYFIEHALGVARGRVQFIIDYVTVRIRMELHRIYTEDLGDMRSHPLAMVIRSEEL